MTRGIQQQSTVDVVAVKTPQVQLSSGIGELDSALARFQNGVTQTLDGVLDFLNSHFMPANPVQTSRNSYKPDNDTLYDVNGLKISGAIPLVYTFQSSAIVANATTTLVTLPMPIDCELQTLYVNAPAPTAGSATINGVPVGGVTSKMCAGKNATKGPALSLFATASSGFTIPAGPIVLVAYVGEVLQ